MKHILFLFILLFAGHLSAQSLATFSGTGAVSVGVGEKVRVYSLDDAVVRYYPSNSILSIESLAASGVLEVWRGAMNNVVAGNSATNAQKIEFIQSGYGGAGFPGMSGGNVGESCVLTGQCCIITSRTGIQSIYSTKSLVFNRLTPDRLTIAVSSQAGKQGTIYDGLLSAVTTATGVVTNAEKMDYITNTCMGSPAGVGGVDGWGFSGNVEVPEPAIIGNLDNTPLFIFQNGGEKIILLNGNVGILAVDADYNTPIGAVAIGARADASTHAGNESFSQNNLGYSFMETAMGATSTPYEPISKTSWDPKDRLFSVGKGNNTPTNYTDPSDALTILKNGKIGIGNATPTTILDISSHRPKTSFCTEIASADGEYTAGIPAVMTLTDGTATIPVPGDGSWRIQVEWQIQDVSLGFRGVLGGFAFFFRVINGSIANGSKYKEWKEENGVDPGGDVYIDSSVNGEISVWFIPPGTNTNVFRAVAKLEILKIMD